MPKLVLAPKPVVQLTRSGPVLQASTADIERLRQEFSERHCICLPRFLDPGILRFVQDEIERATFSNGVHGIPASDLRMDDNNASYLLNFLANSPALFRFVRQISGCGPIGCFTGRVYRMAPGQGHYDSWHKDLTEHRMFTLSINLSAEVYSGGLLLLRDSDSQRILCEVANTGFGDAMIFRLAKNLEHVVTNVEGTAPRTAFAGWYRSQPDFYSFLRHKTPASQ